jgi:mannose-6-phosphate isomerase-like protein (cupin superfamily)
MSGLRIDPVVLIGDRAELVRYPADEIWLRAVGHGDIQVADYRSVDRDGPPAHSHPWDEVQIVVEGEAEFRIGDGDWVRGGSGSVELLPSGVPHAIRVPEGTARIIQVSIGAPYDAFARDMARLMAADAPLDEIVKVAGSHGIRLAEGPPRLRTS